MYTEACTGFFQLGQIRQGGGAENLIISKAGVPRPPLKAFSQCRAEKCNISNLARGIFSRFAFAPAASHGLRNIPLFDLLYCGHASVYTLSLQGYQTSLRKSVWQIFVLYLFAIFLGVDYFYKHNTMIFFDFLTAL